MNNRAVQAVLKLFQCEKSRANVFYALVAFGVETGILRSQVSLHAKLIPLPMQKKKINI